MSHSNYANPADRLRHAVDHAAHLLPAQGPIQVFIHHNTLHAFEDLTFDEAVVRGAETFGTQPYLPEEKFLAALARGRIRVQHLRDCLAGELGTAAAEPVAGQSSRLDVRLAMMTHPPRGGTGPELRWRMAETDALREFEPETPAVAQTQLMADTRRWVMRDARVGPGPAWLADLMAKFSVKETERWGAARWRAFTLEGLWNACRAGVDHLPLPSSAPPPVRHRDLLLEATGTDSDLAVHDILIRNVSAFTDQGVAYWPLPGRAAGFFPAFLRSHARAGGPPDRWLAELPAEAARLLAAGTPAVDSLAESLALLGVAEDEWDAYLGACVLPLRGWGGIVRQMEERPDRVAKPVPPGSLIEFLAVRLLLDRLSLAHAAKHALGFAGPLRDLRATLLAARPAAAAPDMDARAYPAFHLAQLLGWPPRTLAAFTPDDWRAVYGEIESFGDVARRRVFQLAYEAQFREQTLDALCLHRRRPTTARPRFQSVTCIDEREESFRRHLEEAAPDGETFGTAGFFGVVMYYRGAAEARHTPLCPVVVTPKHWVEEQVNQEYAGEHQRRRRLRQALGRMSYQVHIGTRGFTLGAALSAGLGVLASFPLVSRILFPGVTARLRRRVGGLVRAPKKTRLKLERTAPAPAAEGDGVGFSVEEMTNSAERVLRDIGLTRNFARLVFTIGHGSHSSNNPHESAHDCGACGGSVGGPNGRAIAQILNDPRVRAGLAARGIGVPADTVFVGGLHNTCNEYVKFADTDLIPASHRAEYDAAHAMIEEAVARNAHERARRFESAPLSLTPAGARQHMDARAEDLSQVRPEWGHATNAICLVGRRERSRGLFFDRRAFLTSYDPTQDTPDAAVLTRTLQAVFPVCGGISLEYYFSHVDPAGYGCGTKLPHNITGLLGVMDGAASDLRSGLPWQMVEIHEPMRLLFVLETTPAVMLGILGRHPPLEMMVKNGWVQLTLLDPETNAASIYRAGAFVPYTPRAAKLPAAKTSLDWYRGWRDFLEFAEIGEEGGAR